MLEQAGFVAVEIGAPADTFAGTSGEVKARTFDVFGYPFLARKPGPEMPSATRTNGPASHSLRTPT